VWVFWPIYLQQQGVSLQNMAWIVGVYGFTWGGAQLFTGKLSDRVGRHRLNYLGMWVCGAGVGLLPLGADAAWWSTAAAITGLGMAMLYPNLSAAVADIAHPSFTAFGAMWVTALALWVWVLRQLWVEKSKLLFGLLPWRCWRLVRCCWFGVRRRIPNMRRSQLPNINFSTQLLTIGANLWCRLLHQNMHLTLLWAKR
jgi:MFS family permease